MNAPLQGAALAASSMGGMVGMGPARAPSSASAPGGTDPGPVASTDARGPLQRMSCPISRQPPREHPLRRSSAGRVAGHACNNRDHPASHAMLHRDRQAPWRSDGGHGAAFVVRSSQPARMPRLHIRRARMIRSPCRSPGVFAAAPTSAALARAAPDCRRDRAATGRVSEVPDTSPVRTRRWIPRSAMRACRCPGRHP